MLTGGSLGSRSHASDPPSLPPRPPSGSDGHDESFATGSRYLATSVPTAMVVIGWEAPLLPGSTFASEGVSVIVVF